MTQPTMRRAPAASGESRTTPVRWVRAGLFGSAVVLLGGLACGDGPTAPPPPPPPPPPPVATTVAVSPSSAALSSIGETVQLAAEVRDQNGRAMSGAAVAWASSDQAVTTVDASGLATAAGNGTATITATSGSASGTAAVTVEQSAATVAVSPDSAALVVGDTVRLSATVLDALGGAVEGAAVAWSSRDTLVATVDGSGLVRGLGPGRATVTAASGSAAGSATVAVEQSVERVTVTPDSAALVVGDSVRLSAAAYDALGNEVADASFAWSSADTLVAAVDSAGVATGIGAGTVEITATSAGVEGRARLVVAVAAPTTVAVTPDSASLTALGDTIRLAAEVFDQVGRPMPGAAVAWSSGDSTVATVDSAGLVRAEGPGATTVTAISGSASGSAWVSVTQSASTVAVTPAEATVGLGDTLRLAAEALDANGHPVSGAEFSWSSSDPSVVSVDGSGLVRGVAEGASTITAATGDAEGTAEITVANPDRAALVALYEATDGPNWVNNENWLTDAPLGNWYGVDTDATGRVVSLNLAGEWSHEQRDWISHGLTGPIPSELGNLARLEWLDLGGNRLMGSLPPELGDLANLGGLSLTNNSLTGPIPRELGSLGSLRNVRLDNNRLEGPIPADLANLGDLEVLRLGNNQLTGSIPAELGGLGNLRHLWLGGNGLTGAIPAELGGLGKLEHLSLGWSRLEGSIPAALGELSNLRDLYLASNSLTGSIPPSLGSLTELRNFDVGGNRLEGSVPVEIGGLTSLVNLRLWGNTALSGSLPATLTRLTSLRELSIEDTGLCAPGTTEFATWLKGIRELDGEAYCNESDAAVLESLYERAGGRDWVNSEGWLDGPALEEWHGVGADSLGRVSALDLAGNGLSGELPYDLGLLAELTELRVGDNGGLTGRLPVLLTRLPLSVLHYAGTDLCSPAYDSFRAWLAGVASHEGTGAECAPLGEREVLAALYEATDGPNWAVSDNWLTDAPLAEWHGVETDASGRMVSLDLNNNGLTGLIPPELGRLTGLERLNLYSNPLFGPVPPELGDLANLQLLFLGNGHLTGPIPPELGDLANLKQLFLVYTQLSGPIPRELGKLRNLQGLHLYSNDLSGPIPLELGGLANLAWLELSWNGLSGPIPPELGRLANLEQLVLGNNGFKGPIPPELGDLTNLMWLDLGFNALSGPIPPELGGLARLEVLSLLNNELSGSLPSELGRLSYLKELDLTHNTAMSGPLPSSLTNLDDLEALYARGTGLCAADDDANLWAWLAGVPEAHVASCGAPATAYLVQAVQSREFPVPLVAGEEALLRVFVTAARESDAGVPPVRARFYLDGTAAHGVDIGGSSVPVPTKVDEGDMSKSANAVIPGDVVRPGLEMVIEVDPDGTLDPGLGVTRRIPATGRLAVEVREMPPFDLTVIPFLWASEPDSSVIGIAEEMASDPAAHELLAATRTLLPVADIAVTAHALVTSSSNSAFDVLRETQAIRALEGGSGHHMGLMARFHYWGGVADLPGRSSVSIPSGDVIAHELGHNMNLRHAPCGGAGGPDPRYPYPGGSIGAWGYDFPGEYDVPPSDGPVRPWTDDLMGYCGPNWISDYHFTRALNFRQADEVAPAAAVRSILVWGGVDEDGVPFLEPSFVVHASPALPDSVGQHSVVARTADGSELFSLGFTMPEIADADGASAFVFVVPAEPGWASALAGLTLTGPEGEVTLDRDTDRPMAILRDPRNGQVRGFHRDLAPAVAASDDLAAALSLEPGLEALFSRGIPDPTAWRR